MDEMKDAVKRRMSFLQTLRAVLWSFLGLRRGSDHERDMAQLNPVHVIMFCAMSASSRLPSSSGRMPNIWGSGSGDVAKSAGKGPVNAVVAMNRAMP